MTKKTILTVAVLALGVAVAAPAMAQTSSAANQSDAAKQRAEVDRLVELVRKDVRADKADIVAKTMNFDASQAAAFWPVYKQYEAEAKTLGDERLAVIQDLAEHFDSLNDANAKGLLARSFAIEEKKVALRKKYADEMMKVLPAKTVARFFQVESRLDNLISLKVSSEIPLVD
jgi:hypothetical protein